MADKLFHPVIHESVVTEVDTDMLEKCAMFLHDLGWLTQQGMFDCAVERLRWWAENKPEEFLKACATGLTLCLGTQK